MTTKKKAKKKASRKKAAKTTDASRRLGRKVAPYRKAGESRVVKLELFVETTATKRELESRKTLLVKICNSTLMPESDDSDFANTMNDILSKRTRVIRARVIEDPVDKPPIVRGRKAKRKA